MRSHGLKTNDWAMAPFGVHVRTSVPAAQIPSAMSSASTLPFEIREKEPLPLSTRRHFCMLLPNGVHCHTFVPGVSPPLETSSTSPEPIEVIV